MIFVKKIGATADYPALSFINSANVRAFPCGRRRSIEMTNGGSTITMPLDPEARLNTEANNRKHSGLNGFTQTYLKAWDSDQLSLSLAGYFFTILLDSDCNTFASFAGAITNDARDTKIYANIRIDETPLYFGDADTRVPSYYTGVLASMQSGRQPTSLDCIEQGESGAQDICYFSGLSFSSAPLTRDSNSTSSITNIMESGVLASQLVSLCVLEKVDGEWVLHQPALLPHIEHGSTEDSVAFKGNLEAQNNIYANVIKLVARDESGAIVSTVPVPALEVVRDAGSGKYQLRFYSDGSQLPTT